MPKQNGKEPIPYYILGSGHDQNTKFYERYDASFLYNKVVTLLYVINQGEPVTEQIEGFIVANGGGKLAPKYLESLRSEVFFTALHQCETFFAMLIALFQPLPHWVYLTTYETKEIKEAIDKIVEGRISELTDGTLTTIQDLVKVAVYSEIMPSDPELAARWDDNLNNAAWIIERIGRFFQEYDRAYNSYKHGLRVMTGALSLGIVPQNPDGTIQGPMRIIQSAEDALTYLQREPVREVDGQKERPISEVTKVFSPPEASFYMFKMQQMLETIRTTRLARLKNEAELASINTFFGLDRDHIIQLAERSEWRVGPARADEARGYQQYIDQMRATAKATSESEEPDGGKPDEPNESGESEHP